MRTIGFAAGVFLAICPAGAGLSPGVSFLLAALLDRKATVLDFRIGLVSRGMIIDLRGRIRRIDIPELVIVRRGFVERAGDGVWRRAYAQPPNAPAARHASIAANGSGPIPASSMIRTPANGPIGGNLLNSSKLPRAAQDTGKILLD